MQKMWDGRFSKASSTLLEEFNASIEFDRRLYKEDIRGSIVHATMLSRQDIISEAEKNLIIDGLEKIQDEIESGLFSFHIKDEDIHMAIEKRLIELVGDIGKKLHTARSRNDQVAVDFRMFALSSQEELIFLALDLAKALLARSKEHLHTIMPGMTHLQHAQPISFAYHLLAYVSMIKRDIERFSSSINRNNYSPLGCAALAGTTYPTDREFLSQNLGFRAPTINCLDTVSDRDFVLEGLFNISTLMMHLSRLSEELIIWSSYEFKFVEISDEYATGSSIMPQKKNPDIPELIRGKVGRCYGNLISLLTVMKALPLAYNKDTQEDKEPFFDSVDTANISLRILKEVIDTMKVNKENMKKATKVGHLTATDLADYLVKAKNIPFREAHSITGKAVALAEKEEKDVCELSLEELKSIDDRIDEDALLHLLPKNSMESRNSEGGTSSNQVERQILYFEKWIKDFESENRKVEA
jgi:argininosuccinate lyase